MGAADVDREDDMRVLTDAEVQAFVYAHFDEPGLLDEVMRAFEELVLEAQARYDSTAKRDRLESEKP